MIAILSPMGLSFLIQTFESGRYLVQNKFDLNNNKIAVSVFFDVYHSSCQNLQAKDINQVHVNFVKLIIEDSGTSYLEDYPELGLFRKINEHPANKINALLPHHFTKGGLVGVDKFYFKKFA